MCELGFPCSCSLINVEAPFIENGKKAKDRFFKCNFKTLSCQNVKSSVKKCATFDKRSKLEGLYNFHLFLMNFDRFIYSKFQVVLGKKRRRRKQLLCLLIFFALGLFVAAVSRVEWMDLS